MGMTIEEFKKEFNNQPKDRQKVAIRRLQKAVKEGKKFITEDGDDRTDLIIKMINDLK